MSDPDETRPAEADELSAFANFLGLEDISISPSEVSARLKVRAALLNRNGGLHGGAIMALADTLGGTGAFANIRPGESTTTVESKTNFFRPLLHGEMARAVSVPLHLGRRTSVWQTSIYNEKGKLAAMVTQTQMTIAGAKKG